MNQVTIPIRPPPWCGYGVHRPSRGFGAGIGFATAGLGGPLALLLLGLRGHRFDQHVAQLFEFAAQGVTLIINNRPDDEEPGQPKADDMRSAAEAAGLKYEFLPVVGNMISEADVVAFDRFLRELPAPTVAFCRSGNRCSILWSYVQALRNRS